MNGFSCFSIGVLTLLASGMASADMTVVRPDSDSPGSSLASIYFNSGVSDRSVSSLLNALSDIAIKYPGVKEVNLYLNSGGGSMEAGYVAYEYLKRYPIHVNTINAAATDSSATMVYCASEDRYSEPLSSFLLHPAAAAIAVQGFIKPDQAKQLYEDAERENVKFSEVYKGCLKLSASEVASLLSSESNRKRGGNDVAKTLGLVTRDVAQLPKGPEKVAYFITDGSGR